jgi:hypothetical protein
MIANGIRKSIIIKKETTWGTAATAAGADIYRRVQGSFNLKKESYDSNEIRTDYQTVDSRHGVRSVDGSLNGELSPGSYSKLFAAMLAKDFVATAAIVAASVTIAASGLQWTVTRAAGSYLTDGVKVGDVFRLSVGTLNAANINKNLLVVALTATVATVVPLNGVALVVEGPIASTTITVIGKKSFIPLTGHTNDSFTVEEFWGDVSLSHLYTGNKVSAVNVSLPATGLCTCDVTMMGRDLSATGTSQYFTSPTAQSTAGTFASVSGVLIKDGVAIAVITNMTINATKNLAPATVVGSNVAADMFNGKISVAGSLSVYFQDAEFRDAFNNETEFALTVALTTGSGAAADFVSFTLPRVKAKGFTVDDNELGLSASMDYVALRALTGGAGTANEATTIMLQDSLA